MDGAVLACRTVSVRNVLLAQLFPGSGFMWYLVFEGHLQPVSGGGNQAIGDRL